jgi:hypothetical protein
LLSSEALLKQSTEAMQHDENFGVLKNMLSLMSERIAFD